MGGGILHLSHQWNWGFGRSHSYSSSFQEASFSTSDVNYVVDSLGNGVIVSVHMWYRCSNFILDASICNYYSSRWGTWWLNNYVVKLVSTSFIILLFAIYKLKTKQSEKLSMTLWPGESSEWRGKKEEKILLSLLSKSTMWLLMRDH